MVAAEVRLGVRASWWSNQAVSQPLPVYLALIIIIRASEGARSEVGRS